MLGVFVNNVINRSGIFTERTILLKDLKFYWIYLKIILLTHQNNFIGTSKIMSNAKNFDNLATRAFYIIILTVQNCFSDLYPAKILNPSAKPFFS